MLESQVQKEIVRYLEAQGHYVVKVIKANKSGVPDLLVCSKHDGMFYGIEVKVGRKGSKTTKLQELNLQKINQTGGKAFVARCVEDLINEGL